MKPVTRSAVWMSLAWALAVSAAAQNAAPEQSRQLAAQGLDHFYSLEYDEAIRIFEQLRDADPRSAYAHHRVALAYFYQQLHEAGVFDGDLFGASNRFFRTRKIEVDPALDRRFQQANQTSLRLCEERLRRDRNDQEALYACGVAYASRAAYQGLIPRSLLDSMGSAGKANDFHTRLIRLNARYYDAYMVPGLYDFALGSLPRPLKLLLFFVGKSGEKERGIRLVESVAQWGDGARRDAQILLTVMYRRERRFADARRTLAGLAAAFPRNYVFPLEIASIHRAADETEQAIGGYEAVLARIRQGATGFADAPAARIHFELGDLYRKQGDLESARRHLTQVASSRGNTPELERESALLQQQITEALRQQGIAEAAAPSAGR
ncbi:MAG: tetratricopeptide repeat protein [Terriglobia bacterium]